MWTSKPLFSNLDYLVHELLLYKHINTLFFPLTLHNLVFAIVGIKP